jgi:hypothetical protein
MDNINIGEVFKNAFYLTDEEMEEFKKHIKQQNHLDWNDIMESLKAVVELVIDKCAEESKYEGWYIPELDNIKQSILSIKNKIKYE